MSFQNLHSEAPQPVFPPPDYVPGISKVPGIEVYVPESSVEKRPEIVDFKCPHCGASTAYSVETGKLTCEYCGYTETLNSKRLGRKAEGFEFRVDTLERSEQGWGDERKDLACQSCGGVVSVPPDTLAFTCPFCGSNKVLFRAPLEDVLRPRYLIPFTVEPQDCAKITGKWLGSSWMTPKELRNSAAIGKFNPIYIPYWTFGAICNATWKAEVAHQKTVVYFENGQRKERHEIEWRPEAGKVQKEFKDLLVPGTTRLNLRALARIDQFNIANLVLYEPRYLAGMHAQAYDVPLEEAWKAGRQIMREDTRQACLDRASNSQVRNFTMALDFDQEAWRYILTPVYTSVYQYSEHSFQILINGQTGRIAGPRPVDWHKVWLVIAALIAPGILTALVGLLLSYSESGSITAGIGFFLIVVGVVIAFFIFHQAQEMENV